MCMVILSNSINFFNIISLLLIVMMIIGMINIQYQILSAKHVITIIDRELN